MNVQFTTSLSDCFGVKICLFCILIEWENLLPLLLRGVSDWYLCNHKSKNTLARYACIYMSSLCVLWLSNVHRMMLLGKVHNKRLIFLFISRFFFWFFYFCLAWLCIKKQRCNQNILISQIVASLLLRILSETTCGPAAGLNNHWTFAWKVFFAFELTRHMETGMGWTEVTTSLLECLTGRISLCTASQESLSVNDAVRGTFSAKPRNPLDGGSDSKSGWRWSLA